MSTVRGTGKMSPKESDITEALSDNEEDMALDPKISDMFDNVRYYNTAVIGIPWV